MPNWSKFSPDEVERRRVESVEAMKRFERKAFDTKYQEECDSIYWKSGQCCAGCDFWNSEMSNTGQCLAAQIVSGRDVLLSIGIHSCTYDPPPGHPYTRSTNWCGRFKDEFDWSALDVAYLGRIGALDKGGALKLKPRHSRENSATQ